MIASFFLFVIIFLSVCSGCIKKLYESFADENGSTLVPLVATLFLKSHIVTVDFIWFVVNESKLKAMIQSFRSSIYKNEDVSKHFGNLCMKIIKFYWTLNLILVLVAIVLYTIFSERIICILPAFYEDYGEEHLIFGINLVHSAIFLPLVISVDLLPIIGILKFEAVVKSFCIKMESLTNGSLAKNEQNLDRYIKIHIDIIA
jgi:hypothetical protein